MRKFGMLFQGGALFDSLPVWENVAFGLIQSDGMAPAKAREQSRIAKLGTVGLGPEIADLFPSELSGGMQKRVALARAIAGEPEIIFFDEPTTGLDPIMADVINDLIVKCVSDLGATAVSITHDMAARARSADRIAMLYEGKHDLAGPVAETSTLRQRPCRPVHPRPRRRPDPDARSPAAWGGRRWEWPEGSAAQERPACPAQCPPRAAGVRRSHPQMEGPLREPAASGTRSSRKPPARGDGPRALSASGKAGCSSSRGARPADAAAARATSGIDRIRPRLRRRAGGGSALLIGGDPGIGKSTLLLQAAAPLAAAETAGRLHLGRRGRSTRCSCARERLGLAAAPRCELAAATIVRDIVATLDRPDAPGSWSSSIRSRPCVVDTLDSAPGTVTQVRACGPGTDPASPSRRGFAVLLVGHVTKDGQIAGPRVLEHMVDTVLYFEGERGHQFRILRAVKNRFGPTDEIGVFEMTDARAVGKSPTRRPCSSAERARPGISRRRRLRRHRRHAAAAGGDPGAGGALGARHAAPRGGRLGQRPAGHGAGGAGSALRLAFFGWRATFI